MLNYQFGLRNEQKTQTRQAPKIQNNYQIITSKTNDSIET